MARKILEIFKDVLIVVLALAIVVLTLLALPARTITSTPWLAASNSRCETARPPCALSSAWAR